MPKTDPDYNPATDDRLFEVLVDVTRNFPFKADVGDQNEPQGVPEDVVREYRLKKLIHKIRAKAVRMYYRTPERFRVDYTKEDWIQEAFTIFFRLTFKEYRPKVRGKLSFFNQYVLFVLGRRLISKQIELYRRNPSVIEQLKRVIATAKERFHRSPTLSEIAKETGLDDEIIKKLIPEFEEDETLEEGRILLTCLQELDALDRLILIQKYSYEMKISKIAMSIGKGEKTVDRRLAKAKESLRNCFNKHIQSKQTLPGD